MEAKASRLEGRLFQSKLGNWKFNGLSELPAGTPLEVKVGQKWEKVSLNKDPSGFYLHPRKIELKNGIRARLEVKLTPNPSLY